MIALKGLTKRFGPAKPVLRGVDLTVERGDSVAVIGGSGSGKSVLLKCVIGLLRPEGGEIWIDGVRIDPRRRSERELDRFGMLFQGSALFDSLRVWENVAFRLTQRRHSSRNDCRDLAIQKLARVGLGPETADLFPTELSGGMQKRAALARAIAADPEIIFFDEPTTGLDPIMSGVINALIRELVTEMGATAISITHDMASARVIADRVAMLDQGRMRWTGGVDELDRTDNAYVRQFVTGAADGPITALR